METSAIFHRKKRKEKKNHHSKNQNAIRHQQAGPNSQSHTLFAVPIQPDTRLQWRGPRPDPRARVDGLTAASGGDGGRHGDPGAAGAEEAAVAVVGKVAVAAADAGGTAAAVAAAVDECVG